MKTFPAGKTTVSVSIGEHIIIASAVWPTGGQPRQARKGFNFGPGHGYHPENEAASYSEALKNKSCNLSAV